MDLVHIELDPKTYIKRKEKKYFETKTKKIFLLLC